MLSVILAAVLIAAPSPAAKLEGAWSMGGQAFLVLEAGGKGTMDGDPIKWSSDGKGNLKLIDPDGESETIRYSLEGDQLTISMEGAAIVLTRGGAAAKNAPAAEHTAPAVAAPKAGPAPTAGAAGQDDLSRLLLSSAWCSFSYSQISGTTRTTKVQYFADGSWALNGNRESLSSGPNGSVYGANTSAGGGRWAVKNGTLHMSSPPQTPELSPVPLEINRNSNGYPIIKANGVEYSMCN